MILTRIFHKSFFAHFSVQPWFSKTIFFWNIHKKNCLSTALSSRIFAQCLFLQFENRCLHSQRSTHEMAPRTCKLTWCKLHSTIILARHCASQEARLPNEFLHLRREFLHRCQVFLYQKHCVNHLSNVMIFEGFGALIPRMFGLGSWALIPRMSGPMFSNVIISWRFLANKVFNQDCLEETKFSNNIF